ncbi:MAG TPA: hypothetical protein VEQ59_18770, partial [Polyangiaceae bacterium]|nr:hypothetical protein [Polyangiaceae bacterium]
MMWEGARGSQRALWFAGCWLVFAACGGEKTENEKDRGGQGASGSSPAESPTKAGDFFSAFAHGYCTRLFRCFEASDDFMGARVLLKTVEGCESELQKIEEQLASRRDVQAQLAAGRLHYDAEAARRCIAELSVCNGIDSLTAGSCRDVYEGSAKSGEACQRSEDCAGDAYCEIAGGCPGQCRPRKASGDTCSYDEQCSYTTGVVFCDLAATSPVCRTVPRGSNAGLGEPCTRRLSAEPVTSCADDLWCAIDDQLGDRANQGRCA